MTKKVAALGGTFDHFHKGHEHFLKFAAEKAEKLLIGITNENLIREKELSSIIEPYEVRTQSVRNFCENLSRQRRGQNIKFEIVELTDPFGPTLGQREVDQLVVTELTQRGGEILNQKRAELGLEPLPVAVCSMVKDQSGQILNSTRIRQGLVNREGVVYYQLFQRTYVLQEFQKEFFKNPLGELVKEPTDDNETLTAVVGDVCLANFIKNNWSYQLGVYDKHSQRQSVSTPEIINLNPDMIAQNPAGTIQSQTVQALRELLLLFAVIGNSHPKHLLIEGEEDLVTAALILVLPLSSAVYYGQPDRGMVKVRVNEQLKERLLRLFT